MIARAVPALVALATIGCGGARQDAPALILHGSATTTAVRKSPSGPVPRQPANAATPANASALERALGQRIVTGYHGARPTPSVLQAVRTGVVGGVILFGENVPTLAAARSAIAALQSAATAGHQPYLLVMVDQEGGDVKRFAGLPPDISPAQMGAARDPRATAVAQGIKTGRALGALGVNVDLAPVADVPADARSFLGTRAFSHNPRLAALGACGFAKGLADAGEAATLKHFPGLGRAAGNTDLAPVRVGASSAQLKADLGAYRLCSSTVPMVMISSASYPALGIGLPASLDPATYRLLAKLGFRGITITDAFDTPAIVNQVRPARSALKAGVDLLLYGPDEASARNAYTRLLGDAESGALSRAALLATADRILAFKRHLRAGLPR